MTHADGWWGTGTFAYDGFGNLGKRWLSETGANPRRIWNFYDANNRVFVTDDSLPTTSGGASWHSHSYDDRGNMTRSGSSLNNAHTMFMTYDMSDQMVGMSGHNLQEDALTASYQYNGLGKRVYTNMNGRQSYPMYDAGGALREVYKVHDGERVNHISLQNGHPLAKWTGSTLTYLHADHLGTPIRGTHGSGGTSGLTVGDESFQDFSTPYGLNPTSGWWGNGGSGFDPATGQGSNCGVTGFTTHAKDCESGLQYMQARHYSPVVARFMSVDPVGFLGTNAPGMFGRYGYVLGDPINGFDPDGRVKIGLRVGAEAYFVGGLKYGIQITYDTESKQTQLKWNLGAGAGFGAGVDSPIVVEPSSNDEVGASSVVDIKWEASAIVAGASQVIVKSTDQVQTGAEDIVTNVFGMETDESGDKKGAPKLRLNATVTANVERTHTWGAETSSGASDGNVSDTSSSQSPSDSWGMQSGVIYGTRGCGSRLGC